MKKAQNKIQSLEQKLRKRFSDADISLDSPARKGGEWFLDIENDGHNVVVRWKEGFGFGITCSPQHSYGEGADEVYEELEAAFARIVSLLIARKFTSPPASVRIGELRKERGVSQEDLAALLEVRQAAVSKLERRHDVLVSTVRDVVRLMGGELRLIAKFPDGMERTLEFEEEAVANAKQSKAVAR